MSGSVWILVLACGVGALFGARGAGANGEPPRPDPPPVPPAPPAPPPAAQAPEALSVVTFNVRYANAADGANRWEARKERALAYLAGSRADFIGLQEVLPSQMKEVVAALPGYGHIARSRDASPFEGESTPIFYDRASWVPVEGMQGTFWLSETPEIPGSRSWRSGCPRIATWAIFRHQRNGRRVLVLNTHLDNESQQARDHGARAIAEFLATRSNRAAPAAPGSLPPPAVIVTGDFNAGPTNSCRRTIMEGASGSPPLRDAYRVIHPDGEAGAGTFHGFRGGADGPSIDAIMISAELQPKVASIDRHEPGTQPLSDHYPLRTTLEWVAQP
ncbi:MAG: endonuclease/exonuclease/phosphatase family protein [Phycisphaerales bacterium]